MALVCPITRAERKFPLHVSLDDRSQTSGAIMCEQVKSLDVLSMGASFKEKVPLDVLAEVVDILSGFIE